jgi:uncharacterized protein YciI
MTESERTLLGVHDGYWRGLSDKRIAMVFGPVIDPKGARGLDIIEAKDESEVHKLLADDPVAKANVGFSWEISPMAQAVFRKGL